MNKNIYNKILSHQPVVIAEAGVNHNGYKKIGKKLIDAAKRAGADCIKFQTYKSNKLTTKNAKRFWSWEGERKKEGSQHDSYSVLDSFEFEDYKYLANYCKKKGILKETKNKIYCSSLKVKDIHYLTLKILQKYPSYFMSKDVNIFINDQDKLTIKES